MPASEMTLYAVPASHPCAAVEVALTLKQIPYRRVDLLPLTQLLVGPPRWGGPTVPGLRIRSAGAAERLVGSRAIMRRLDELEPAPALLPPAGASEYARVLELERWGDEVLQPVPRRIIDAAFVRMPQAMAGYAEGAKLPLPIGLLRHAMPLTARGMALRNSARDEAVRADLAALPRQLERIDGWIGEGLLGAAQPNAADLQIGSSIRLLASIGDVRGLIEGRPAAALAAYFPPMHGEVPPGVLPRDWLAGAAPPS